MEYNICKLTVLDNEVFCLKSRVYGLRAVIAHARKILSQIADDKVTVYAAQASFFVIISAIPFLSLLISIAGLLIKPHELIVVGAMILTKFIGTVFFVIPHLIKRTGMSVRYFVLYSLFEPALLALSTGMVCYWQYYLLRGQLHEIFLLALAGISGCLIYFPALYFMMFDHAEKIRAKKLVVKFTGKLRRA